MLGFDGTLLLTDILAEAVSLGTAALVRLDLLGDSGLLDGLDGGLVKIFSSAADAALKTIPISLAALSNESDP
jgi:hypothetical protein